MRVTLRIQALSVWTLLELLAFGFGVSYDDFAFPADHSLVHNYSRFSEIEKHCNSFISSASELEFNDIMASSLRNELSFFNGDWEQDSHGANLMPFDDSDDMPQVRSSFISPWKVVSFEVQNVSSGGARQPQNTVGISGVLSIGITRNSTIISEPGLIFHKRPGMSALRVDFEGIYLETEDNGGERLVCLLGNSTFPFKKVPNRYSDGYWIRYFAYNDDPVTLPHDQIMLVIRYPKSLSFSTGQIFGEMTSLNEILDYDYFDKVRITSHLDIFREDHLKELILDTFDQNPLQDAVVEDGVNKFNNSEFCGIIKYFEHGEYRVMPSLKYSDQYGFQVTIGPFRLDNEIMLLDRNNEDLRVIMHKIKCEEEKVTGVLRMYPATIKPHVAARRTGLTVLTLSVKGIWNSSTGMLRMTGCRGPTLVQCDSGVILYFPKSFSSKQRSVITGSIFSLLNAFPPVFIGLEMLSPGLHDDGWYSSSHLSYNYSKRDLAFEFKEKVQEPKLMTYIRKLIFQYPALEEEKDGFFNISNRLADELMIDSFSSSETFVRVEVLSLGPLFRTNDSLFYQVSNHEDLNISLNLLLIEKPHKLYQESYGHVSKLYLEGVYDQQVGKLYLIGCRKVDFDHVDLERGLDCLIEVTIEYSPMNTRWLKNPTAKITIVSQRNKDDAYHFKPIRLQNYMIHDKNHEENVIFREIFEGYFRIFLLLMIVAHILNQTKKMKKTRESVSYISLLMLGLWIVGYGITVIYSKEILIKSYESQNHTDQPYDFQNHKRHVKLLDYFARFLVLVSMFLMARISEMVLKARKELRKQGELAPSEKKVLLVALGAYVCYFLLSFIGGWIKLYLTKVAFTKDVYMQLIMNIFWYTVHDIQDYYLAAYVIAHHTWKSRVSEPLVTYFVLGLWIPYIIRFVYEVVRDPVIYPA